MKRVIIAVMVVLFLATLVYGQSEEKTKALYQEGLRFYNKQDFRQAAQKWEQALEVAQSIEDSVSLLEHLGDVYVSLSDYRKAVSYYNRAGGIKWELRDYKGANLVSKKKLKILKKIGDKEDAGHKLSNLAFDYYRSGDYQKGISYRKQALEIWREIGDKEMINHELKWIGSNYKSLGEYQQAISYYQEALKDAREAEDKDEIGSMLEIIGATYTEFDNVKAIPYLEQAQEIYRELGNKKDIGGTYETLGMAYVNLGDYAEAISHLEQALKIYREVEYRQRVGVALFCLSEAYKQLGDYAQAISHLEQALKIFREIGSKWGVDVGLTTLGILYFSLDHMKGISYLEQALKVSYEEFGGNKKEIEFGYSFLGYFYALAGDNMKAISYYEQGLKVHRELGNKKEVGDFLRYFAFVWAYLGDYVRASSCFEEALKIYRELGISTEGVEADIARNWIEMGKFEKAEEICLRLGDPHLLGKLNLVKQDYRKAIEFFEKSLREDLQSRDFGSLLTDYIGLGQAYEGLKEYARAKESYEKLITMREEQRKALAGAEADPALSLGELTTKFFATEKRFQTYEGMVRVLINMNSLEEAFFYSENLKARVLAEAIARGRSALEHNLPSGLAEEENSYITEIRRLRKQMEALYRNKAMDTYYEREKELQTVKAKQQEFIRKLRSSYPEYTSINYPQPIKPDEVKLEPNEVLIEFEVTDEATYVLMLKEGKLKTRRVSISREELQELVLQYRGFFEGITKTSQLLQYKPEVGKKLYTLLFGDLLQSVAEGSALIIVPDEFLGILPFEALVTDLPAIEKIGDGEYGPFPLGVKYLGDRVLVSYAQSATSLTLLRTLKKGEAAGEGILVVADPIFSANDPRLSAIARAEVSEESLNLMGAIADWKQMGVAGVRSREKPRGAASTADEIFPRLEKTEELAREMESLFGDKAKVLLGADAKEDKVVGFSLPEYRYLVFATHGI